MSLYDEAMAAGAKNFGGNLVGHSVDPSRNLTPAQLRQYLSGDLPEGYSVGNIPGQRVRGTGVGADAEFDEDLTSGPRLIYGKQSGSGFHTQGQDVWDEQGNYLGESSGDSNSLSIAKFIAMSVGGYYGAQGLEGVMGAPATVGGSAATGVDAAALEFGLTGVTDAAATGVIPGGANAGGALAAAESGGTNLGQIVVNGGTGGGGGLPTLTYEQLALGTGAGGALAELGTIPQSEVPTDPSNYSNEGRNYPNTESTQGPGGSPINASQFPGTPITDVDGNPVVQPIDSGRDRVPTSNPFGTGDFRNLFDVLSGLYGLKLANDAAEKSDPFGPYRKGYADKLLALEANPGLIKSTPGFMSGQDSITRQMASKGYLGSGNQAGALARFSGDFYNAEANRLAGLAGANIAPGNTHFNHANLVGQSLSNIGYGLSPYIGGGPR